MSASFSSQGARDIKVGGKGFHSFPTVVSKESTFLPPTASRNFVFSSEVDRLPDSVPTLLRTSEGDGGDQENSVCESRSHRQCSEWGLPPQWDLLSLDLPKKIVKGTTRPVTRHGSCLQKLRRAPRSLNSPEILVIQSGWCSRGKGARPHQ